MPSVVAPIPIQLDRLRHIRMTNRAIFQSELELSKLWNRKLNVLTVLINGENNLTLNDVAILLWQGLLQEDPRLTLPEVQDMLDLTKLDVAVQAILQAWNAAVVAATPSQEGTASADPLAPTSTGPGSGVTAAANLA